MSVETYGTFRLGSMRKTSLPIVEKSTEQVHKRILYPLHGLSKKFLGHSSFKRIEHPQNNRTIYACK